MATPLRTRIMPFAAVGVSIFLILDPRLRRLATRAAGSVFDPWLGHAPSVPAILLVGGMMVAAITLVRHLMTDWVGLARKRQRLAAYQRTLRADARDAGPRTITAPEQEEMLALQSELTSKQLQTMPLTLLIAVPTFGWLSAHIAGLAFPYYTVPWNDQVGMLDRTVLPHWVLLYMCLSIPLGSLLARGLKAWRWRDCRRRVDSTTTKNTRGERTDASL